MMTLQIHSRLVLICPISVKPDMSLPQTAGLIHTLQHKSVHFFSEDNSLGGGVKYWNLHCGLHRNVQDPLCGEPHVYCPSGGSSLYGSLYIATFHPPSRQQKLCISYPLPKKNGTFAF